MTTVNRNTRVATDAQTLVDQALSRVSKSDRKKVEQALAGIAGQNRDRYLNRAEAQTVVDAFEKVAGGSTGLLGGAELDQALALVAGRSAELARASDADGVSAHFSFEGSLEAKLIEQLHAAVADARGRPLDVNMMIFQFQSDEIEQAIADIARKNPNVTFRIVADSSQASSTGGNALPSLLKLKLANIQVKFKKDFPYVWSSSRNAPVYNHGATKGLNHHKGFATLIDGVPDRLVTGSFNWSDTADEKNYEDLVVMRGVDASTRGAVAQYHDEFAGFFNSDENALSPNAFYNFKQTAWNELVVRNGGRPSAFSPKPPDNPPAYVPGAPAVTRFDLNGFLAQDKSRLATLVGSRLAGTIWSERSRYGRFDSLEELAARVPAVASLPAEKLAALKEAASLGSGGVSVNNASVEELDQAGFSLAIARAIVAYREANGDFESVDELMKVPGMSTSRLNLAKRNLAAEDIEAFFNSRAFGAPEAFTGYGSAAGRLTTVLGSSGRPARVAASVTAAATDLFNRATPGQTVRVAMYGMSTTSAEFRALVAAARRGVDVRVVLNDDYTASTVTALKALAQQGLPVDVRVQKAKTMHEKFGVVGDDVFFGSANFSESSSTKHSEDRFVVKNSAEISGAFTARFESLWEKSRVV